MWFRNLVFIGLCAAGLSALAASLAPLHKPPRDKRPGETAAAGMYGEADVQLRELTEQIDAAFEADWRRLSLTPVAPADDLTLARRLSLALVGMVPSLEEVRRFEAGPPKTRVAAWREELLADRRAHDYLAERLARAYVGVQDGPFVFYRRRRFVAWLADQLSANRPYDQIVADLIADSGLWTDHPATNFITVTVRPDEEKGPDPGALAARVARAFLGVRLDCAECHDHPFERWKQSDFQSLAAFFSQTRNGFTGIHDDGQLGYEIENPLSGKPETAAPRVPFLPELLPAEGAGRDRLAVWVTHPKNRAFGREIVNRIWAQMFGKPLVEPIDDLGIDREAPAALDLLADDFVQHGYDLRRLVRAITQTRVFRLDSRAQGAANGEPAGGDATPEPEAAWAVFPISRLRPEQVIGGVMQACRLRTIDYESNLLTRIIRVTGQNDFIKRYGDAGEEEFSPEGGTIPQRLLMMNGGEIESRIKENIVTNAATQIAALAPSDEKAIEVAYLAALTRRPAEAEARHFAALLAEASDQADRRQRLEDLYWCLLNSTEFSWNH